MMRAGRQAGRQAGSCSSSTPDSPAGPGESLPASQVASPLASQEAGRETRLPAALREPNTKIVKKPLEGLQTEKGLIFSHVLDFFDVCGVYGAFWMTF